MHTDVTLAFIPGGRKVSFVDCGWLGGLQQLRGGFHTFSCHFLTRFSLSQFSRLILLAPPQANEKKLGKCVGHLGKTAEKKKYFSPSNMTSREKGARSEIRVKKKSNFDQFCKLDRISKDFFLRPTGIKFDGDNNPLGHLSPFQTKKPITFYSMGKGERERYRERKHKKRQREKRRRKKRDRNLHTIIFNHSIPAVVMFTRRFRGGQNVF